MKQRIEFYQEALKPSQDLASLKLLWQVSLAIVLLWGLVFAYATFSQYQLQQHTQNLQADMQVGERNLEQLRQMLSELNARQNSGELDRIEQNIKSRQQLLGLLQQKNLVSYAKTLQDLALIPWDGVALQGLTLQGKHMILRGETNQASAVPAWILGFEKSSSLRGHQFGQLAITQQPEGGLSFSLYSAGITP